MIPKTDNPLRFGILGAARIGPDALISPAKSHADVVVYAVAARNEAKAKKYAKTHGIAKTFSGAEAYQRECERARAVSRPVSHELQSFSMTRKSTRSTLLCVFLEPVYMARTHLGDMAIVSSRMPSTLNGPFALSTPASMPSSRNPLRTLQRRRVRSSTSQNGRA